LVIYVFLPFIPLCVFFYTTATASIATSTPGMRRRIAGNVDVLNRGHDAEVSILLRTSCIFCNTSRVFSA
jgi:hypothetical protein